MFQLLQADGLASLYEMEDESINCITTDPAYSSLEKHRSKGSTTRLKVSDSSSNQWFDVVPNDYIAEQLIECYRVLKPNSHMYIMCDQETAHFIRNTVEAIGQFTFWKNIIWDKARLGMGYHYRCASEVICFLEKGHRNLNDLSVPDILRVKSLRGKNEYNEDYYPTEKPVELSEILIKNSTNEGDLVLDLYAGSGSILEACVKNNRKAIGIDTSGKAIERSNKRLTRLGYSQSDLFIPRSQQVLFA